MLDLSQINPLATLLAFVIAAALAAFYFPVLIAKPYLRALGREAGDPAPTGAVRSIGPIVCVLVVTLANAVLVPAVGAETFVEGLVFGLVVGFGYLTAMTFQIALNPNFPRPLLYGAINAPFFLAISVIQGVVLALLG